MSTIQMVEFLKQLEKNNSFTWMHDHQMDYKQAKQDFIDLATEVLFELGKKDDTYLQVDAKKRMGRLVRDTRFSKDKTPYNPRFMLHMSPYGNEPIPCGPFLCLKAENSIVGGGLFLSTFAPATQKIREAIDKNSNEFTDIIKALKQHNIQILGESLKRVPKPFDPNHPLADYLKYKSWYVEVPIDNAIDEKEMIQSILYACDLVTPLNEFLNHALGDLRLPKRPS